MTRYALDLFQQHLPFHQVHAADSLVVAWYNFRTGGDLPPGSIRPITGPGAQPPSEPGDHSLLDKPGNRI